MPTIDLGEVSGKDGVTYTPSVSKNGVISFENDGGLPNPDPVNIMGPQGDPGKDGKDGLPGEPGEPGKNATINGRNVLSIEAGDNISIDQIDDTLVISASGGGGTDVTFGDTLVERDNVVDVKNPVPDGGERDQVLTKTEEGMSWEDQIEYEAGDGIDITDSTVNVTNPTRGIYTQSEYDSLPPERKMSGTYFVDDGGEEAMVGANIYSTEEQVIGRWIDGRPIYRVSGESKTVASLNTWQNIMPPIKDVEIKSYIVVVDGVNSSGHNYVALTFPGSMSSRLVATYHSNEGLRIYNTDSTYANSAVTYTLEYTKTTDPPILGPQTKSDDERILDSVIEPPQFHGQGSIDGVDYDYFLPESSPAPASASASSANFHFGVASDANYKFAHDSDGGEL